jgi:hypothetical protein
MRRLILLALLLGVAFVPSGSATTLPDLIVGVSVSLKPETVAVFPKQVRRGYYVQFKVHNATSSRRLFSVAGRTISVPPKKFRYLVISFDVRGKYQYASRKPAGTAVHGTFVVT